MAEGSRLGFVFPGQGAQYVGMGKVLLEGSPAAVEIFRTAERVLGYDLASLCVNGPAEQLNATIYSQPALFTTSMAALAAMETVHPQWLSSAVAAAGLSLGEYTAVAFAGAVSFEDGLMLVQRRGAAMQAAAEQQPSGMASVIGMEAERLAELCDEARQPGEVLQLANLLCPGNIAVSGHQAALARLEPLAMAAGATKVVPLAVAGAFHTSLMRPAVDQLQAALDRVAWRPARLPIWSNVDALPHREPAEIRALLAKQVVEPVQWEASLRGMLTAGLDQFVEVGAGKVLRGTIKRIDRRFPTEGFGE
jgi:[acyl-carrier-protein] S-malonyltransferase